jgi:hypothetical protein
MKTIIWNRLTKLSLHSTFSSKTAFLTLVLLCLSLNACQKENIALTETPSVTEQDFPITDIIALDDKTPIKFPTGGLDTRGDLPDIDDVPVVVTGIIINCDLTPVECAKLKLEGRVINAIKPGQRLGIAGPLTLAGAGNQYRCYRYITDEGIRDFCGYNSNDKDHPLNITANGNYRIQLSAINDNTNLDMFIYRHTVKSNGDIDTTVVAYSNLPAGMTETIHLTKKGYYTIVVDGKAVSTNSSGYVLSVSSDTDVRVRPILTSDNELVYQFRSLPQVGLELKYWSFRKKVLGQWIELGRFDPTSTFGFSCNSCDYLVSPVYLKTATNTLIEGEGTLFRP